MATPNSSTIVTPDPKRTASTDRRSTSAAEASEKSDLEDDDVLQLSQDVANAVLSDRESTPIPAKLLKGSGTGGGKPDTRKPSYAEKAGKPRQREDFLLYVQSGKDKRLPINKLDWDRAIQAITVKVAEHWMAGGSAVFIKWNGYTAERGLIACADEYTSSWVRETVASIRIGDKTFRAWRRNEYGDRKVLVAFCGPFYKALGGEAVLAMTKRMAPYLDSATFLAWTGLAKGGFLLRVLVDKATELKVLASGPISLPTGSDIRFQAAKTGEETAASTTPKPN